MRDSALGATALAIAGGCGETVEKAAQKRPPNIILIMTDDQGFGDVGCHGNDVIKTPNLDRLYADSVRFNRFFVSPTCSPTRSALLCGRHEFRCGISHTILGRSLLFDDEVTSAEMLSNAGYATGIFGKWHLGDNHPCRPEDHGFEECLYHGGGGITQSPDYWGNTYFSPTLRHNGSFEKYDGFCTDIFFREAMGWMSSQRSRPFFAYIVTNAPHFPYTAPEEYAKPYLDIGLDNVSAHFYGMITNIDDNMGHLMQFLRESGLEENTLLIFLTDNGSAVACGHQLFNAGMKGCKGTPHEGGVRVPCWFRLPGRYEGGRDIDRIAAHIDILPTLADICGCETPAGRDLDGRSLLSLLDNNASDWSDRYIFTHQGRWPAGADPGEYKYRNCSVRNQRFRLVNNEELYDMEADPSQITNVIGDFPDDTQLLREAYEKWWDSVLPRLRKVQHIKIGSPDENPSSLACMDWRASHIHEGQPEWRSVPIWMQNRLEALAARRFEWNGKAVRQGTTGSWAVEVARNGSYRFTLRKLPKSASEELNSLDKGEAFLSIGDVQEKKKLVPGDTSAVFEVELKAGETDLECWFTGQRDDGDISGAYFVEVERL